MYYRLNGLTVQLPALRERTDFAALTAQLLADLATEHGQPHPVQVAPDLLQRRAAHPGPGNLRQSASVLRTACAMLAEDEDQLGWEHLGDDIVHALQTAAPPVFNKLAGLVNPRPVPSPPPARKAAWTTCARPTAAPCSSMKSATCRCPCKTASCACCKTAA